MSAPSVLAASPGRLRAAAGRLGSAASVVATQSSTLQGASADVAPSWSGVAADMFRSHCERLAADARTGWTALGRASEALATLASRLEYAQQLARESQSFAASAASMRAQAAAMDPSPMIHLYNEEAYAASSRSATLEAEADRIAREAAAHAASVLREVASSAPSRRDRGWGAVMNLRAAELGAYLRMHLSALPGGAQAVAGRELAQMFNAALEGEWDEAAMTSLFAVLEANASNSDFAAGFFNELGGRATVALVEEVQVRYGAFTDASDRFTRPLGLALGVASGPGNLEGRFVDELLDPNNYEGPMILSLAQLVEHGTFETDFAVRLGDLVVRGIVYNPTPAHTPGTPDRFPVDLRSVILHAVARTPDAARELLLMRLDEPILPGTYVDYIDILMRGEYMGPESGVGALIRAATIDVAGEDRYDAARVVAKFVTGAPDVHAMYALPPDVRIAMGAVAREWWSDFVDVAYGAGTGAEWAQDDDVAGSVHDDRVRVSMDDLLAYLEVALATPEARAEVVAGIEDYTERMVARALDMPIGDARDHVMQRVGASIETFSIADTNFRELSGKEADEVAALQREIVGGFANEIVNQAAGRFAKPINIVVNEYLDHVFESNEQIRRLKEGELAELRLRLGYRLEVIAQANERGLIPPGEHDALLRYLRMEGESEFDGIRRVTRLMDPPGTDILMDGLRQKYLHGDDRDV
ncbi:MAG: WXG100 family type VII secretion target [Actinomycetota bacterium]